MIIFTPLDFPKLVPDDWDVFWDIWERKSGPLVKRLVNTELSKVNPGTEGYWKGLDLWTTEHNTVWDAPAYNARKELPNFYETIDSFSRKIRLYKLRLLQSTVNIPSHTDNNVDNWNVRGLMHYTSDKSQWYFTKPHETDRYYISMPKDTMWFAYNDGASWHGTDFDPNHKKILIQLYFVGDMSETIRNSINKYQDYTIDF